MIEKFINKYPISKTLRFKLTPVGKTEEYFVNNRILENDKNRAKNYVKVKGYMDRYYKDFIESVLSTFKFEGNNKIALEKYVQLYYILNKSNKENGALEILEKELCAAVAEALNKDERYKKLYKKEFIKDILPEYLSDKAEKEAVSEFNNFVTYFTGFWDKRANIFTKEVKSTSIGYRCIVDNLPKFLDNVKSYEKIASGLQDAVINALSESLNGLGGTELKDMFTIDYFSFSLSQTEITHYNYVVGEINKQVNLYNQQVAQGDRSRRLPLLKALYKQILSDRESVFDVPDKIENDDEALELINNYFLGISGQDHVLGKLENIYYRLNTYDQEGIHIKAGAPVTDISNAVFGSWSAISESWNNEYEQIHPIKSGKEESYYDNEKKEYKKIKSFSIAELQRLGGENGNIVNFYSETVCGLIKTIESEYAALFDFLSNPYNEKKRLSANDKRISDIKELLDSVKDLEKLIKPIEGTGKEDLKDNEFYAIFLPLLEEISSVDLIYNRVRNYVTQKPYSNEKIKLNFDNSSFMSGWVNDYSIKSAVILKDNEGYYLGIVDRTLSEDIQNELMDTTDKSDLKRIIYDFQKVDNKNPPRLFVRSKGDSFAPSVQKYELPIYDILEIYDNMYYKKEYAAQDPRKYKESLTKLIDYFKLGFTKHESYKHYDFKWKESSEYRDIAEFYRDTASSCYALYFESIKRDRLMELVDSGKMYLFRFDNKDFSPYSKGKPNLHTMYFKMLFDERNLEDVVYKLSGGAEMFYREASIKEDEKVVHHAKEKLDNKNPDSEKKQSVFDYDIIKDKRYTKPQFALHLSVVMNFKAPGDAYINNEICKELREKDDVYVIGIDRGERNLIYISVIDGNGHIVEQRSLNVIGEGTGHKFDYQKLLDNREVEMNKARRDWKTIGSIANIKEGYLSQVIHYICELVVKYDAIIAMEDLNDGFVNSRVSIGKQVYKKFENMLTEKLNYLVSKNNDINEPGGLLRAYQLTNKVDGKTRTAKQNGIIFYVPAWLTSKIDPTTGFVSLLKPKYTNREAAREFFGRFDDIRHNAAEGYFEFDLDYDKFPKCNSDYRKKWTVCTYGDRIETFRNPQKNSEWDNKTVDLTAELKDLFEEYGINIDGNIKEQITAQNTERFFKMLIRLLKLTLQMRNSITKNVDVDYIISPVKNSDGRFYDSREYRNSYDVTVPVDADANGAYHIALKGLWVVEQIKQADDPTKAKVAISNSEWLKLAQTKGNKS